MAYVITQNCCNEASCVAVCPVNCIHPTPDEPDYSTAEMLYIDPQTCIDCGACADVCPVEAIVPDFDLTEENSRYEEINARYFSEPAHAEYPPSRPNPQNAKLEISDRGPVRVAIVGSGPSGCYAAEELLSRKDVDVEVHMFERLPSPWGLVRFGVAPDHQATKSVIRTFTRTAGRSGMEFHLNVEVGTHVSHQELLDHHHGVIYTVGAPRDRKLDVVGENLPGSYSATDFVAWYNGHPDFAEWSFDLSCERAVIVGNGNVALDVARILVSDPDELRRTDIADHALSALSSSKITEVVVLGRRGPLQAAFTTPELIGLMNSPGFDVEVSPSDVALDPVTAAMLEKDPHSMAGLKRDILAELSRRSPGTATKRIVLGFLSSPVEIVGDDHVRALRLARNELTLSDRGRPGARATGETYDLECGLVLRSIGYRGMPLPKLPFDDITGTVPNAQGRVIDGVTGTPVPGVYTAGWIKRGPSGVIGTNKKCARETVACLLDDFAGNRLSTPSKGAESLRSLIATRQPQALDFAAWEVIDRHERMLGRSERRPRVKLTSVAAMLQVVEDARTPIH